MTLPEVFDHFNNPANDRSWWPVPDCDKSVPLLTAGVSLSGQMNDCRDEADLQDAIRHTMTLVSAGILTTIQWATTSALVEVEMDSWAEACNAHLSRIAESN